jgi:hypothetical protein
MNIKKLCFSYSITPKNQIKNKKTAYIFALLTAHNSSHGLTITNTSSLILNIKFNVKKPQLLQKMKNPFLLKLLAFTLI